MPKEIHEIKTFLSGTITTPDSKDIPEDAAQESLNIDATSSDGKLIGIPQDTEITDDFKADSMSLLNINGERLLVGVDEDNGDIKWIDGLYGEMNSGESVGYNVEEASIVKDNSQSYIGLGREGSSRPKFVGKVLNQAFNSSGDEIIVEDAEAKRFDSASTYYGIRKVASTIPTDDFTNTQATELNYVWGLVPESKFLFRINVDISDTSGDDQVGVLTPTSYARYSDTGLPVDTVFMSIATCISFPNMLWATGKDGKIYRLHVNATNLTLHVQLSFTPVYKRINEDAVVGDIHRLGGDGNRFHNIAHPLDKFNYNNQPPDADAVLSDIIEVRNNSANSDDDKFDLIISFYKEEGFNELESYIYKRRISPFDVELTEDFNAQADIEDKFNEVVNVDAATGDVLPESFNQNILFEDISAIFSGCRKISNTYIGEDGPDGAKTMYDNKFMHFSLRSAASISEEIDEDYVSEDFPSGSSYAGYKKLNYGSVPHYGYKKNEYTLNSTATDNDGFHKFALGHPVDADGNDISDDNDAVLVPEYREFDLLHQIRGKLTEDFVDQNVDDEIVGDAINLGMNVGFLDGFKLHINRFGLIALHNNISDIDIDNIAGQSPTVGLYAYADKDFVHDAGLVRLYSFYTDVDVFEDEFGDEDIDIESKYLLIAKRSGIATSLAQGFFITINTDFKLKPKISHYFKPGYEDNNPFVHTRNSPIIASSAIAFEGYNGNANFDYTNERGSVSLMGLASNSDVEAVGGFSGILPSNIESMSMDRFGDRNYVEDGDMEVGVYRIPSDNDNLCFLSESIDNDGNEGFESTKFWSVDWDTVKLFGGELVYPDGNTQSNGLDYLLQGKNNTTTYMTSQEESNLGGAAILSIWDTATADGGAGDNVFQTWYFSLHATDTNNYSNGILPLAVANTNFNDWGSLSEKSTAYAAFTFNSVTGTADENDYNFTTNAEVSYKVALVYDNGAVSKLSTTEWRPTVSVNYLRSIDIKMYIHPGSISPRVSAIKLFRRGGDENGYQATQYVQAVVDMHLSSGWSEVTFNGEDGSDIIYYTRTVKDTNLSGLGTYEEVSGLTSNEVTEHSLPNYSLSTMVNNTHIIGKCFIPNMDDYTNYLFASNPGIYNVFNIANELKFCKLPTTPTALKGFAGRLFAFDENNTYIVNTTTMLIEDELEGIGCASQKSVVVTEFSMFFADNANIYQYDGQKSIPIGNSILTGSKYGWLNRAKDFKPILAFDGSRLALVVIFKSQEEVVEETAFYLEIVQNDEDGFDDDYDNEILWEYNTPGEALEINTDNIPSQIIHIQNKNNLSQTAVYVEELDTWYFNGGMEALITGETYYFRSTADFTWTLSYVTEGLLVDSYHSWVYNLRLKRWDRWGLPEGVPKSAISGKDGEVIISTDSNLAFYANSEESKRGWHWISKDITLGVDTKYKKFYELSSISNSVSNDHIRYKVNGSDFTALNEDNMVDLSDRKSKSLAIEVQGTQDLEVDSLSLTYRHLPTSKNNV